MSHKLTKEELDAQFEEFLKESVSDDSVDLGSSDKPSQDKTSHKLNQKPTISLLQDDEHGSEATAEALSGSRKSFKKSLRKFQPLQEEEEEEAGGPGLKAAFLTTSSTDAEESVMVAAGNPSSLGLDTLEEEEEKAKFFAQLEAGASATIDYSKLNTELDSTNSKMATDLRKDASDEQNKDNQSKVRVTETVGESQGSPHYSEDFEEKERMKELLEKPKMSPILARVSLYDSLDDEEDRQKNTGGLQDRGQLYAQSGLSEIEALQEAYRQIHTVEDSDEARHLSVEEKEMIDKHSFPSPPPQHTQQSLQPASTNESDLPTAEELMRPFCPEHDQIRGFTLQPVRSVELDQEKLTPSVGRTFLVLTESALEHQGKTDSAAGLKGTSSGQMSHGSRSPEPPSHELTWSIRKEVNRLMQDENKNSSQTSSHKGKVKKQLASCSSSVFQPSACSEKRPTVAPVKDRIVHERAAINNKSSRTSKAADVFKTQPATQYTRNQEKHKGDSAGLRVSSELVAPIHSLMAVLQQQTGSSSHQDAVQESEHPEEIILAQSHPQIRNDEDYSVVKQLRVQLAQKEMELQMMERQADEISSLRRHNYLLQSKLRRAEEVGQKKRCLEAGDPATDEKLTQIHKKIQEQETLIKGYQQENEKLYLQMKAQQAKTKANEEAMFNENQRLMDELDLTREQLREASRPVGSACLMDPTQIHLLQRNEIKLSEDNQRLKQEKQSLEVNLQLMKKERDLVKVQTIPSSDTRLFCYGSGEKTLELRVLENRHREEVAALKKKLQWFAENQELLNRDAVRLKAATAEILQLKEQVEKLRQEVGKRSNEQQRKTRDRSADTKRIQELEWQVKDLEQILRSRNPNSLPALIYAAATAADENTNSAKTSPPSRINTLLESRIQRLEAELESHDEEAKCSLRAMEQQFYRIKLCYEQQISELEQQLEQRQQAVAVTGSEPWKSKCQLLEEKLQHVNDSHQETEKYLRDQIESLQQQLKNKSQPSPGRHQRQAEAAFGARIERLNQELTSKTRSVQELSRTVERLQKERKNMLCASRPETYSADTKQRLGQTRTLCSSPSEGEPFPAAQCEKIYQPMVFTGSHISEVLQQNEALKQQMEMLQLHSKQETEELKAQAVQAKEELSRLKECCAEQLLSMKTEHLRVLDHLCATHALEHSSSKVAELTNKLNSQEIAMRHLQEQLTELQGSKEALTISQSKEETLQRQLMKLLLELKEAKEAQSSEVKLLCNLERKIMDMELRHEHREKELQQIMGGLWQMSAADLQSEVERWRHLAQDRSRELDVFRTELDSILDILRHLQKQGVALSNP